MWTRGSPHPAARLLLPALLLSLLCLPCGCRDEEEGGSTAPQAASSIAAPAVQPPSAGKGEAPCVPGASPAAPGKASGEGRGTAAPGGEVVAVYPLGEPLEPAPEEERQAARAVVDYANRVQDVLGDGPCGTRPLTILRTMKGYRELFVAEALPGTQPPERCARDLADGTALFGDEAPALAKQLEIMDEERLAMQRDYQYLREYVADETIMDDGVRGEGLCLAMEGEYTSFANARARFFDLLDDRAEAAQLTLLRTHPLREQVRCALRLFAVIRRASDLIQPGEPEPLSLGHLLEELSGIATTAERLPFPVAGEVEMHYRHFLRSVREVQAVVARGRMESFHPALRAAFNSAFLQCRNNYNLFVGTMDRVPLPPR